MLVWISGKGQVSFMELTMDFECFARRALPVSPLAECRGTALPLPERARVLELALTALRKHVVSGVAIPGGVLTKCSSLIPLGGPPVVAVSARPYFTYILDMMDLLRHLQGYCEERWAQQLSCPPSLSARQQQAQEAHKRQER